MVMNVKVKLQLTVIIASRFINLTTNLCHQVVKKNDYSSNRCTNQRRVSTFNLVKKNLKRNEAFFAKLFATYFI